MSEVNIQRQILDFLTVKNIFHWRSNNLAVPGRTFNGLRGLPDICCIIPGGIFLGIEVKSEKGKQTDDQKYFQTMCSKNDALYTLVRSFHEFQNFYQKTF